MGIIVLCGNGKEKGIEGQIEIIVKIYFLGYKGSFFEDINSSFRHLGIFCFSLYILAGGIFWLANVFVE